MIFASRYLFLTRINILSITLFLLLTFTACSKGPQEQEIAYSNDFETNDLRNISGGLITDYNNSFVLGRYNNDGFSLHLSNMAKHDLIEISFDLFIHDSWDGNDKSPQGPDIWKLEIEGVNFISTTFSNRECSSPCLPQSYPFNYLNSNQQPKSGAFRTDLPGVCLGTAPPRGSTLYKIVRRISHRASTFSMRCLDELVESNTVDPLCDESWSVDNLVVKTVKLD